MITDGVVQQIGGQLLVFCAQQYLRAAFLRVVLVLGEDSLRESDAVQVLAAHFDHRHRFVLAHQALDSHA